MRKKEIIIHIGMHKTGSSSIQQTLHKYMNDKRFTYVDLGHANHSRQISSLFEKNISSFFKLKFYYFQRI